MLRRVIEKFGLNVLQWNEVDDSHSSTVYQCTLLYGKNIYLKIPFTRLKFQRELAAYKILQGSVPIPYLIDYWPGDEECPGALLLSELRGKTLTARTTTKVIYQVGTLHANMHSVTPSYDNFIGINNEFDNWSNFIERQFQSFAADVRDILDERLYEKAIEKYKQMKQQLPPPDGPSFVHMDFRPANIIVHDGSVSGVIDFESVRFGSTEIDFTKLYRDILSLDSSLYQAYKDGYNSIRPLINLEDVLPFYQFTDAFNSIGWCKRRGVEKNALFLEENVARLKKWVR
ncbi:MULTISPECIES: aminoglycoside phosphotransferase family protein [Clostridia]|uniref:aminoglycoside phosphotransferase family protein n=1 Tax=Clostridia TaxID=186801 RepID=UPI000EA369A9|nr:MULTISPECIES: aminoglycoside phosphotransferase family protein [Clostridia]NBJ70893.1 aminoglycoside phosphotransferase family protein [Roseburia sp. 1XD42-34]RKI75627.1 aminoglycoside phosphotransferase family protein [Clostridium sp. 1xD42-85]